jgi:porin
MMYRFAILLSLSLAIGASPAFAEGAEDAKEALVWSGGIKLDTLNNSGGQHNGTRTVSHLDAKLAVDLELLGGWAGGTAMLNVISNSGSGPAANNVGNLMGVSNIEVPYPTTTRLFQAWVQRSFLDDRAAILVGLYPIDSEFFAMDSAGVLLGPQYGAPADLAFTRGPSLFNNSAFGIRTKLQSADKTIYALGALLDGVPNDPAHPRRTAISFGKGDGTFRIGELGWLPEAGNDGFQGHAKYAAGYWAYSAKVDDQLDLANGLPLRQQRSTGGYFLGEQTLLLLEGEGRFVTGFGRYTWTDGRSTPVESTLNLGLHFKGLIESRLDDVLGVGWTRATLSDKWRAAELASNGNDTYRTEEALEITYRFVISPTMSIQPTFQHIAHPGGVRGVAAANLVGFRIDIAL